MTTLCKGLALAMTALLAATPATRAQDGQDLHTNLSDGIHQPVMRSYVRLGYQIELFGEKLVLPDSTLDTIEAGGVIYHEPRFGGMYRFGPTAGVLDNAFVFADYTYAHQPVNDTRAGDSFVRNTHFLDAGLGYFFKLVEDRIELAPYLGMSAQFNFNDRSLADDTVYYRASQNRLGFGLGGLFATRFDDTLPFPLFLFVNLGLFPLTPVSSSPNATFPPNLTVIHLTGSFYGRFLPYLGGEVGIRQQIQLGGESGKSDFSAYWTEFFLMLRFEPEGLFSGAPEPA